MSDHRTPEPDRPPWWEEDTTSDDTTQSVARQAQKCLASCCFPADREGLLEHGVIQHAPPPVLELLKTLPRHRSWSDLPAVLRQLDIPPPRQAGTGEHPR